MNPYEPIFHWLHAPVLLTGMEAIQTSVIHILRSKSNKLQIYKNDYSILYYVELELNESVSSINTDISENIDSIFLRFRFYIQNK
jgi:hypothetical protein